MTRPRLLDLFCGAGGCSVGYHRAGFDVTGVDIAPRHRWPFWEIHQGDARAFLRDPEFLSDFDAIHASPPCQAYSAITRMWNPAAHDDLVSEVRTLLMASGKPWIIENVPGSPLINPVVLCGSMFGLAVPGVGELRRHRLFETSFSTPEPPPDTCGKSPAIGVYGNPGGSSTRDGVRASLKDWRAVMDLGFMSAEELAQAIPPAYTEWIGTALMQQIEVPGGSLLSTR